jgi:HSP20 family protein
MALVRYDPFYTEPGMNQLRSEINRIFSHWGDTESSGATAGWVPTADIHEYDDRFRLFVDLPGVDPSAVDITLERGVLTISGERSPPADTAGEQMVQRRVERGHGHFHRRFILPDSVDAENVKATGQNGVLEVSIPKQQKAKPRRIKVAA